MKRLDEMIDDNNFVSVQNLSNLFLANNGNNDVSRELLSHSLFYYCSGKDPSPIIAFESLFPLYIYVDLYTDPELLYRQLSDRGLLLRDSRYIEKHSCSISIWTGESDRPFGLLYIQGNANDVFLNLYSDKTDGPFNLLLPKAVCNQRYEMPNREYTVLPCIEKRTEYVIGYCFSSKYRRVGLIDYCGDFSDIKIAVFRRMYYYY